MLDFYGPLVVIPNFVLVGLTLVSLIYVLMSKRKNKGIFYQTSAQMMVRVSLVLAIVVILYDIIVYSPSMTGNILATVLTFSAGSILPLLSFSHLNKHGNSQFLHIIFILNILCNSVIISMTMEVNALTEASVTALSAIATLLILNMVAHTILHLITHSWNFITRNRKKTNQGSNYSRTNNEMLKHYHDKGLNADEINYFRDQMATAKDHINNIEANMSQAAKLRAIDARHNTIKTCQNFFKDIVSEPKRITDAGEFLYKLLPSLEDLTDKYSEINGHVAKNKQTYLILDKSAQVIELLSQEISDAYIQFHRDTYNELDEEIEYASRIIKRSNSDSKKDDNVESMLDEMNDFNDEDGGNLNGR